MIKLTAAQEQRRINIVNYIGRRILTDKENGEFEFLNLLFKYQLEGRTKGELKKYINKLYGANKGIQQAYKDKAGLNNYQADMLATEHILQMNKNILYTFFNLAYSYLK